jgi:hypothetical protein
MEGTMLYLLGFIVSGVYVATFCVAVTRSLPRPLWEPAWFVGIGAWLVLMILWYRCRARRRREAEISVIEEGMVRASRRVRAEREAGGQGSERQIEPGPSTSR